MISNLPSLRKKILVPLLLVLVATLAVVTVENALTYKSHLTERLQQRAARIANTIRFIAGSAQKPAELQHLVGVLGGEDGANLIVVVAGEPARVVASTRMALLGKSSGELRDREMKEEMGLAVTLPPGHFRFDKQGAEFDYFHPLSVAVQGSDGLQLLRGTVTVSLDTRPLRREVWGLLWKEIAGYSVAVLLLAAASWMLLDRHVLRPLKQIGNAVAGFRVGNATRISDTTVSTDEFSELTAAWNGLIDRLAREEEERTLAQDALLLQQTELRVLFDLVPAMIWFKDTHNGFLRVNQRVAEATGLSIAEIEGKTAEELFPKEAAGYYADDLEVIRSGASKVGIIKKLQGPQGQELWIQTDKMPICDQDGKVTGLVAMVHDITARKVAEARVLAEKARISRQRDALIAITGGANDGDEVMGALRRLTETVARTMGIARVSLWRYNDDRTAIRCVDLYELETDRHSAGLELPATAYPAYFQALAKMDVISAEDANRDPRTCEFSEHYLQPLGITSMLDAPIHLGGAGVGVLCHEHIGPMRQWTPDEETFAVAVANRASLALEGAERQRAEVELRSAHSQLEQMIQHSAAVIYRCRVEGERIIPVAVSANLSRLLGVTPAEALSCDWWQAQLHPDDRERALASSAETMRNDTIRSEYRVRLKEGGYRWVDDSRRLLRDESGQPMEIIGVWIDITERKRSEAALKKSESRYHSLFDNMLEGYAYCRTHFEGDELRDFTYLEVNGALEKLTGLKDVVGKKISELVPGILEANADLFKLYGRVALTGRTERVETFVAGLDVWLSITIYSSERGSFVGIFDNITERKRVEAELQKTHAELVNASRLAGMSEVATSVLHNVGNVLNSVNVSCTVIEDKVRKSRIGSVAKTAELLQSHTEDLAAFFNTDPAGRMLPEYLGKLAGLLAQEQADISGELHSLSENIDHIKEIVAMQQSYGRVSGLTEMIDLAELVEASLRMSEQALNRHQVKVLREYEEVPPTAVEKAKVLQILVNLISNAKSACSEAGAADKQITLRVTASDGSASIAVADNGVGIPSENLTRIFSLGFTTKSDGHGFGLHGSVLAAREMGGDLTVHSEGPGKGACFTLLLPFDHRPTLKKPPK